MPLMPVIVREMRVSARYAITYYLRSLGAAALLVTCLLFGLDYGFRTGSGDKLFGSLHLTLFLAIWILVPLLSADCISRERREGTLGLLFLTRLRPHDVVIAKGMAHGLRAMTLWLAVLPALMIPFLLGGVGWREALLSVMVNLSAMCWALAAGLLASAWSRRWSRALITAASLSLTFLFTLGTAVGQFLWLSIGSGTLFQGWRGESESAFVTGLSLISNITWVLPMYTRVATPGQLFLAISEATLISFLALVLSIVAAGAKTRSSWQDKPPSREQVWFQRTFCQPVVLLSFFRRWMRNKLERNPVGWLEQRTWSGRLVTWGWFAVIISLYSAIFTDKNFFRGYSEMQRVIACLLAGSLAMSAAGSFRRERETGMLELLLVSPLGESQIISGRLGGLWGQFLPAFGLLLVIWAYFSTLFGEQQDSGAITFYALTFLSLPVIGLYFSLCCRNVLSAFLSTIGVGLLLPLAISSLLRFFWFFEMWIPWRMQPTSGPASFGQSVFAIICWFRLHDRLKRRAFPLDRREN